MLAAIMTGVAAALLANLHLHFFVKPKSLPPPPHPFGPILYGLLVVAVVAAVAVSIWWAPRPADRPADRPGLRRRRRAAGHALRW